MCCMESLSCPVNYRKAVSRAEAPKEAFSDVGLSFNVACRSAANLNGLDAALSRGRHDSSCLRLLG